MDRPLKVCYFGTYRAEYARNQILIAGLRRAGVDVVECHERLWQSVEDRVGTAKGGWLKPRFWWRLFKVYYRLFRKYQAVENYDILIVGYPGHYDVFLARLLSWMRRKPLVWDVLNSLYLITLERGILQERPITSRLIRILEKFACRLPEMMILDTPQFVEWFHETHAANPQKFSLVQIGADERFFYPIEVSNEGDNQFRVIYYGSYIPNHGVEYIIDAARLLKDDKDIMFVMIGSGPERQVAQQLVLDYHLENVEFIDWLDPKELVHYIARADLVLGVFGKTLQLTLTNNNKIYEAFAMRKPVISSQTSAIPPLLVHKEHLYLSQRGQPETIADGIRELKSDPELCQRLAENGYVIFSQHFNVTSIGEQFAAHLDELLNFNHA